ncbi:hypothetical protein [Melissospora conviva]|uniref:hypothetical protein n=1 Tax=Melissospora conviva TaxID=3388432 RepID=UPI003C1CDDAE
MIEQDRQRVPMPVVAAAAMIATLAVVLAASLIFASIEGIVVGLLVVALFLALAYGLWRGSRHALFWTTVIVNIIFVIGVLGLRFDPWGALPQTVGALLVFGLVRWPASSRRWFRDLPAAKGQEGAGLLPEARRAG